MIFANTALDWRHGLVFDNMTQDQEKLAEAAYAAVKGMRAAELSAMLKTIDEPTVRGVAQAALAIREMEEETAVLRAARVYRDTGEFGYLLSAAALYARTTPLVRERLAELEAFAEPATPAPSQSVLRAMCVPQISTSLRYSVDFA